MKMNKTMKSLTIAAALAVMIPLSAYAATDTTTTTDSSASSSAAATQKDTTQAPKFKQGGFRGGAVSQEVLDLLKLDAKTLQEKLAAGKTLAQIADEQGVTRDALKAAMTTAFDKQQAEQKQKFTDNLDKTLDGQMKFDQGKGMAGHKGFEGRGGGIGFGKLDLTASAKLFGLSADELKKELAAGKSLADVAKEKGVDVQTLIDAQKQTIVDSLNAAVTAGKMTQEQADKAIANAAGIAEKIVNGTQPKAGERGGAKMKHRAAESDQTGSTSDSSAAASAGETSGA
ncbi:hypothetical protein GZH47_21525 [Paenibacillus rhizovicinus]|uniref:LysM domain-containing protein n=1 Tax=Paenibacillus rhizovicinus TaxID=2704463 RepID=A0A6C0P3P4_9BACL|nr:hypothetical protein [Paenibacillus rhizovicinus]QHW33128.1 hypothetical protein GZH47_21525 [Paenibacillus rhizovicinus]